MADLKFAFESSEQLGSTLYVSYRDLNLRYHEPPG